MAVEPRLDDLTTQDNGLTQGDKRMNRMTLGAVALAMPLTVAAAPESYTLDPHHGFAYFAVDHFGMKYLPQAVGDEVRVHVVFEACKD